jgi:hypothetical protein
LVREEHNSLIVMLCRAPPYSPTALR